MFVKKIGEEYYICRYPIGCGKHNPPKIRNWFWIKSGAGGQGCLSVGFMSLPKELIGKKIRLKVEVFE